MEKLLTLSKLPILKTIKDSSEFRRFLEDVHVFFRQYEESKSTLACMFSDTTPIASDYLDDKVLWKSLMEAYKDYHTQSPAAIKKSLSCWKHDFRNADLLTVKKFIHEFEVSVGLLGGVSEALPNSFLVHTFTSQLVGRLSSLVTQHFGSHACPGLRFGDGSLSHLFTVVQQLQKGLDEAAILLGNDNPDPKTSKPKPLVNSTSKVTQREEKTCSHCGRQNHTVQSCWDIHPEKRPKAFSGIKAKIEQHPKPNPNHCSVHTSLKGNKQHTNAQCWVQHPELKPTLRADVAKPEEKANVRVLTFNGLSESDVTASVVIGCLRNSDHIRSRINYSSCFDSGANVVAIPMSKLNSIGAVASIDNVQVRVADGRVIEAEKTFVVPVIFEGVRLTDIVCVALSGLDTVLIGTNVLKRVNVLMESGKITRVAGVVQHDVQENVDPFQLAKVFRAVSDSTCSENEPYYGDNLTAPQKERLADLWNQAQKAPKCMDIPSITLPLKDDKEVHPVMRRPIPQSVAQRSFISHEVARLEAIGKVEDTVSPWGSPMFCVPHPRKQFRAVIGYEKVNDYLQNGGFPIPLVKSVLQSLGEGKYFATLDGDNAYNQIPLVPESCPLTAFVTEAVHKQFKYLSFGLKPAAGLFQKSMCLMLKGLSVIVYIDDLLIIGKTFNEFFECLKAVLFRLASYGYELNAGKCGLGLDEVTFLGYQIAREGLSVSEQRLRCLRESVSFIPKNVTQVQRLLGLLTYFRVFVPNFASRTAPLTDFIKTGSIEWSEDLTNMVQEVVTCIGDNGLVHPKRNLQKVLETDASATGVGAILKQASSSDSNGEGIIGFFSHKFSAAELNYATIEQEALAIVLAVTYWRQILIGDDIPFTLKTDHRNLIFMSHSSNMRVQRWVALLSEFDFTIEHVSGLSNICADVLSRSGKQVIDPALLERVGAAPNKQMIVKFRALEAVVDGGGSVSLLQAHGKFHASVTEMKRILPSSINTKQIQTFVRQCLRCQKIRTPAKESFHPSLYQQKRGHLLVADFVTGLPPHVDGFTVILVFRSLFTGRVTLFPATKCSGEVVVNALQKLHQRFVGEVFSTFCSDNATHFKCSTVREQLNSMNLVQQLCTPYSHAGFVEVAIREVIKALRLGVTDNEFWVDVLPEVESYLNDRICERYGCSPNMVLQSNPESVDMAWAEYFKKRERNNESIAKPDVKVNDYVLILRPLKHKLEAPWKGPFRVVNILTNRRNVIQVSDLVKQKEFIVHLKQCRKIDCSHLSEDDIYDEAAHDTDFVVSEVLERVYDKGVEWCLVKFWGYEEPEWILAENVSYTDAYTSFVKNK